MPKSPVFGLGRNWKHRPRGGSYAPSAANINLRGKKYKRMGCGCCFCADFREDVVRKEHIREIRNAERGPDGKAVDC